MKKKWISLAALLCFGVCLTSGCKKDESGFEKLNIDGYDVVLKIGEDGKVTFTIDIPEEIAKEGRTYYLVTVDKDGNIVVLQNESIVNGTLTFTGDPNATYQIVYEIPEEPLEEGFANPEEFEEE